MNPGGNNQARQFIPRTSMPMVCGVLWLRLTKIGPQNGAPPTNSPGSFTAPA